MKIKLTKADGTITKLNLSDINDPFCGCDHPKHQRITFNEIKCLNCNTIIIYD